MTDTLLIQHLNLEDEADWYRFETTETGTSHDYVRINFLDDAGNLDLEVWNETGRISDISDRGNDTEIFSLANEPAGVYYVRVIGHNGATNPDYTLTVDPPGNSLDDPFESNDDRLQVNSHPAGELGSPNFGTLVIQRIVSDLRLEDEADWYRFVTTTTGTDQHFIEINFSNDAGNLDLELWNEAGRVNRVLDRDNDTERLSLAGRPAGAYYLRVVGHNGDANPNYSLAINPPGNDVPPGPEISVHLEATVIIDGRMETIRFENSSLNQTEPTLTFRVANDGNSPLLTGQMSVPNGFDIIEPLDSVVSPGESDTFTIRLQTTISGTHFGQISFLTNDWDENLFNFAIEGTVGPATQTENGDVFEENDNRIAVSLLQPGFPSSPNFGVVTDSLTIHHLRLDDEADWYRFETTVTGTSHDFVRIDFSDDAGNLNLELWNEAGRVDDVLDRGNDTERLSLASRPAGIYYVRVFGHNGATNPDYALTIDSPGNSLDDPFESNDNRQQVNLHPQGGLGSPNFGTLGTQRIISNLRLEDDVDWYRFETAGTGTDQHFIEINFSNDAGNLDLELWNEAGRVDDVLDRGNDTERLSLASKPAGIYYVRVVGRNGDANPNYSLTINPPGTGNGLNLSIQPAAISESVGSTTAIGTVTRTGSTAQDLLVNLFSADTSELTIPATVLIPAGQISANFSIHAVDDFVLDGDRTVVVAAQSNGFQTGFGIVTVLDTSVDNYPPEEIFLSHNTIPEGNPVPTLVGTFSAVDPDEGDALTYALISGAGSQDNSSFVLSPTGELHMLVSTNFELKPTYNIRVQVTDGGGLSYPKEFTIHVTDLPEAPTGLTATATDPTSISLAWIDVISSGEYFVERSTDPNLGFSLIATLGHEVTSYLDDESGAPVKPHTTYYYRIRSRMGGTLSAYSAVVSATTAYLPGTYPLTALPTLNSHSEGGATLFLDFNGNLEANWKFEPVDTEFSNVFTPAFTIDDDPGSFSEAELAAILEIWERVSEDYAPFNINITTVDPGHYVDREALKVVIGGGWDDWAGALDDPEDQHGGVASARSAFSRSEYSNVVFVFSETLQEEIESSLLTESEKRLLLKKWVADTASHEAGHAFGLEHQSIYEDGIHKVYNPGNQLWSPIMGSPGQIYSRSTWWNGQSWNGSESDPDVFYQYDMEIISNLLTNGFGYRADDYPSPESLQSAANSILVKGIIEQNEDVDAFTFMTTGGPFDLSGLPAMVGPNLLLRIELLTENGLLLDSDEGGQETSAGIDPATLMVSNLPAGRYKLVVSSKDPGSLDSYGSVGQYTITGTIAGITNDLNFAPSLNPAGTPTLHEIRGSGANPGTLVLDILNSMKPAGGISDQDPGDPLGMAVIGVNANYGRWEYSTDNGTVWKPLAGASTTSARLLSADTATRIRFLPNAGFVGQSGFTFLAWDQSSGLNGATANTSIRGGVSSFSTQKETAMISVARAESQPSSVAVFRDGTWYLDANNNRSWNGSQGGDVSFQFGTPADKPITGDWNGDGITDVGFYSGGAFHLDADGNRRLEIGSGKDIRFGFAGTADIPVTGDWNGDGKTDVGVWRSGRFYLDLNGNRKWDPASGDASFGFGAITDHPITGDWNGDGKTDLGIFRAGKFYLDTNGNRKWDGPFPKDVVFGFGGIDDKPIVGDWNADGKTDVGVVRNGRFYLDLDGNRKWDGGTGNDRSFGFGSAADIPLAGAWRLPATGSLPLSKSESRTSDETLRYASSENSVTVISPQTSSSLASQLATQRYREQSVRSGAGVGKQFTAGKGRISAPVTRSPEKEFDNKNIEIQLRDELFADVSILLT